MNEKFKYAPGKPGIGTKGRDGSTGLQGLSMFFTDLDPVVDSGIINNKIISGFTLWKNYPIELPDNRSYNVGDLFIDQSGETYEVTDTSTGLFSKIFGNLSSGGFFLPLAVSSSDGYARFFNSNTNPKVIIDNVYSKNGAINYIASPPSIYGIPPIEFARIEYSDVSINSRNPFTVYTSGTENVSADDAKSIAIVRETSGNTFRIGNLDNAGNLRNVNLTFDVSLLSQTKQPGNSFNIYTPKGAILTNYEIAANSLFDPAFNRNPSSFIVTISGHSATVSWVLTDFTTDSNVTGTLYFLAKYNTGYTETYNFNDLIFKPLILQEVPPIGSINITNLIVSVPPSLIYPPSRWYSCYMKISTPNGWTRNSISKGGLAY